MAAEITKTLGTLTVDGDVLTIKAGDTLASCIMRSGQLGLRRSRHGQLRGLYCAIGVCNECLVTVDGRPNVRACITPARPGARVETGVGPQ